jgi:3-oxoacid CoA-transferase
LKVEEIVEIGELDPNSIHLPGIYVDRLIKGPSFEKRIEKKTVQSQDPSKVKKVDAVREQIARRAAIEFKNGMYGNENFLFSRFFNLKQYFFY